MISPPLIIPPCHRVQEYWIWRVGDRQFDWFRLQVGEYVQVEPNAEGIICSQVFPKIVVRAN